MSSMQCREIVSACNVPVDVSYRHTTPLRGPSLEEDKKECAECRTGIAMSPDIRWDTRRSAERSASRVQCIRRCLLVQSIEWRQRTLWRRRTNLGGHGGLAPRVIKSVVRVQAIDSNSG